MSVWLINHDEIQRRSMWSDAHRRNQTNFISRMNGSTLAIPWLSRDQEAINQQRKREQGTASSQGIACEIWGIVARHLFKSTYLIFLFQAESDFF